MQRDLLRVRNRVVRSVLSATLRPSGSVPLVRLGSAYGGWVGPETRPGKDFVASCAGAGEDITFDLAVREHGRRVTTFDPTPRAIAHVATIAPPNPAYRFEAVGWWDSTTELRFYAPKNAAHVSHSAVNLQRTEGFFTAPV